MPRITQSAARVSRRSYPPVSRFLCALLLLAGAGATHAQAWPAHQIRLVVPFAAGGSTDITARVVADGMRPLLGQTVVVDNKPGAGGNIGAVQVAKAEADGYTLLMATSTHATNVSLYASPGYDFAQDLAPVTQVSLIPNLLVVGPGMPVNNLAEFIAYVKQNKGPVNYGSAGNGSSQHLSAALFNSMVGGKMQHVPYKGGAPANTDLLAGQIQAVFGPLVEVVGYVKAGRLKALGITTKKRSPVLPDVPAIGEQLPGYEVALWNGILAPAKTPPEIVAKLSEAIVKVLQQPETRAKLAEQGSEAVGNTPAEFRQMIGPEIDKWRNLVKISGAKVD
ncbi:MAG TPA: tripartite tricarboxylate transporter substrate binding protein [Burkholderiales bacterium]|nr:tripartite tricarboxylate transporter substrate binding protein [Burkholderiales bacterium]